MSEMLQWAQWYHARGMHPMPLRPRDKRPMLDSWKEYFTRQPTLDELTLWWTQWPDANIGLIQGRGMFVLDIDGPEGEAALAMAGIELPPDAPEASTGKGRHIYLQGVVPNSVSALPKVDTRSDGGYVVAPPSIHPSGRRYQWIKDLWPPPAAPEKLLALLTKPKVEAPGKFVKIADSWLVDALAGVGEGQRDIMCARIAGYLWGKGHPQEVVQAFLEMWAETCTPTFPLDEVTKTVASICKREGGPAELPTKIDEVMGKTLGQILAPAASRPPVATTTITKLDHMLDGGFYPGDYILLASRPSVGKSALALQIARESAQRGAGVLVMSLEMGEMAITRRLLVQTTGLPMSVLKTGEGLTPMTSAAIADAATALSALPIWISTGVDTGEGLHEVLSNFEPGMLRLVVVDYLQIMSAEGRDGRARVEHCSKMVKRAAIRHNVPIICISSLARPPREMANWRPELRDLRESGELEHDADIVIMMHRDLGNDLCEIFVRKNRDGKVEDTTIVTSFDGARQNFRESK